MKNRFFTSKAGIIGLLLLVLHPLKMSAQAGITSNRRVVFLHGLNEDFTDWTAYVNHFTTTDTRRMNPFNQNFSSVGGLNAIFNRVSTAGSGGTSIAICHSLGGVVARNLDSRNPSTSTNPFVGGIVTVGSPLDGAPIANALLNGAAFDAINNSANTMARGPLATIGHIFGPLFQFAGYDITTSLLPGIISDELQINKFGGLATISDIQVGGSGITAEQTLAPTATPKISIWGNENSPTHWNITATSTKKNVADMAASTSDFYEIHYWFYLARGSGAWWNAWGWWNFYAAYEWYAGMDWVDSDSERIWNNIIGSDLVGTQCYQEARVFCAPDENCVDIPRMWGRCPIICTPGTSSTCVQVHSNGQSDAWIPASSQRGDGSDSWRVRTGTTTSSLVLKIEALGVNHFEEIQATHPIMQGIFNDIFDRTDVRVAPVFQINRL